MNTEQIMNHQSGWESCIVCGEAVEPGRRARRINHRGSTVSLCSPACLQTFVAEPDPYLARLVKTMRQRELLMNLQDIGLEKLDRGLAESLKDQAGALANVGVER